MPVFRQRLSLSLLARATLLALALATEGCSLKLSPEGSRSPRYQGNLTPAAQVSAVAPSADPSNRAIAPSAQPDLARLLRANPMLPRDALASGTKALGVGTRSSPKERRAPLGSTETFWVADIDQVQFRTITARLQVKTQTIEMWVQQDIDLDQTALERSAQAFGDRIYPRNQAYFGSEWSPGIDGQRALIALHAPVTGSLGYFSATNELPSRTNPYSNEHEMFVLDAASLSPGTPEYESVLAHEHQHMIHWHQDPNEDAWLNEGASELAEDLSGFGWPRDKVAAFAANPDLQLNTWSDAPADSMRSYGASYLFMRYFFDRFGSAGLRSVVAHDLNGLFGIEAVLREQRTPFTIDQLFADWVVANLVDRPDVDPRYGYPTLEIHAEPKARIETYPYRHDGTLSQYAADYLALEPGPEAAPSTSLRIRFAGSPTARLVPADAAGGVYQWWSNRGDSSYSSLERSFDLTQVITATLSYDLWYEIETGWDYGHLRASADGGRTWEALRGRHMTDHNPMGGARGPGYTGRSGLPPDHGGDGEAVWVREAVDLADYVGSEVVLRFEYITDDAINWHGMCLDNLTLAAAGFMDDAESGDGGWTSHGFVRHDNRLEQAYLVQLVTQGETVAVQRLAVDGDGLGEWLVPSPQGSGEEVTLAISALAPSTTQRASYSLWLEQVRKPAGQ